MKTLAIILAVLLAPGAIAQQLPSAHGFWVIEGNPQKQSFIVVRYYTADRKFIGEEKINKPWIDLRKKRNIRKLDRMLMAWQAKDSRWRVAAAQKRKP